MKKILVICGLFLFSAMPAMGQNTDLLVCELTEEFPTGSAYLSSSMQDNFIRNCAPPLRALSQDDEILCRGYTNSEEWVGGNTYGRDTKTTNYWTDTASERPLSEQRGFNCASIAVNDPAIMFNAERVHYTGTAGENLKTVRIFRVPKGASVGDIAKVLDALEGVRTDLSRLTVIATAARDNASDAATASREARDASRGAEDWSKKTYDLVSKMKQPIWFFRGGVRSSSKYDTGVELGLGLSPTPSVDISVQGYAETGNHWACLLYRSSPNDCTQHWGTYYSGHVLARFYKGRKSIEAGPSVYVFIEAGPGIVHVEYSGPSIGWHHTGFDAVLRTGVGVRYGRFSLDAVAAEQLSKFPTSHVDESIANGDWLVSGNIGLALTIHLF